MSAPQNDVDSDESSGITNLRPVPVKPVRYSDLTESDSTQYFSVSELLERGKALAAPASPPVAEPEAVAPEPPPSVPINPSLLRRFRAAPWPRQLSAVLLPLAALLLLVGKLFQQSPSPAPSSAPSSQPPPAVVSAPPRALPAPALVATAPEPTLPRGVSLARAASDSLATGDFSRAAAYYRELSMREPTNPAYAEAARILAERAAARTP